VRQRQNTCCNSKNTRSLQHLQRRLLAAQTVRSAVPPVQSLSE
jgi:hypothetical protein